MTRRKIIYPAEFFDREDTTTMTDNQDPELVNIDLPTDTIMLSANECRFMLTTEPEAPGQLAMWLILGTNEMGYYRILIPREQLEEIRVQIDYFNKLGREGVEKIRTMLENQ